MLLLVIAFSAQKMRVAIQGKAKSYFSFASADAAVMNSGAAGIVTFHSPPFLGLKGE